MKTVNDTVLDNSLISLADALRSKAGITGMLTFPDGFVSAVNGITSLVSQSLSVTPTGSRIILNPSSGYDALSAVYVEGDGNLLEENIRYGATIFSVVGNSDGGLNSIRNKTISVIESPASEIYPYTFYHCYDLSTALFSNCTRIHEYAFYSCVSLLSIDFPNCTNIGNHAFANCFSLESINLPNCIGISYCGFAYCHNLSDLQMNNCEYIYGHGLDNVKIVSISLPKCSYLGGSALARCHELVEANFGACSTIGRSCFHACEKLTRLELGNSEVATLASSDAFYYTPIASGTGSIYVPSSLYNDYISASNWSYYSAQIVAM